MIRFDVGVDFFVKWKANTNFWGHFTNFKSENGSDVSSD